MQPIPTNHHFCHRSEVFWAAIFVRRQLICRTWAYTMTATAMALDVKVSYGVNGHPLSAITCLLA